MVQKLNAAYFIGYLTWWKCYTKSPRRFIKGKLFKIDLFHACFL